MRGREKHTEQAKRADKTKEDEMENGSTSTSPAGD